MQRGSDKHGFRLDDALQSETRGMTQAGHDVRAEEWKTPEPSGEDQPPVSVGANGEVRGGTPEGMTRSDLDERAELASVLGKELWPAEAEVVKERVRESNAPDRIRELVTGLPQGTYEGASEVWAALTGEREDTRF
jgi:hypothetical protein